MPGATGEGAGEHAAQQGEDARAATAAAVLAHCEAAIAAVADHCVAAKFQLACFERLGPPGWQALEAAVAFAKSAGLLVIADGKRGDVPTTSRAYAQALFGGGEGPFGVLPGLGADAVTVNPLLGRDALAPFLDAAEAVGGGCFVLVRTSNPGAGEIQDEPRGDPLRLRLARLVDELANERAPDAALAPIGAVCGATRPELLGELRRAMPRAPILLPGVGAQGGSASAVRSALGAHPASALVTAARSIVDAWREEGSLDAAAAAARAAQRLQRESWT